MNAKEAEVVGDLVGAILELLAVVEDFMPNVGNCALQNYERLNTAPAEGRRAIEAALALELGGATCEAK